MASWQKRGWEHPLTAYSSVLPFFETLKSTLFNHLHYWQKKKVLVCTGFCCAVPSDAGGENWLILLSLDHGEMQLATEKGQLLYMMGQSPSFLFLPASTHNARFLPPKFRANAQPRKIIASSRWGWEGSGGTELQPQLPTQPSWNSPSWGPGLHLLSSLHLWTLYPQEHCPSKCGPWTSSIDFTWEFGRKAEAQIPPQHY